MYCTLYTYPAMHQAQQLFKRVLSLFATRLISHHSIYRQMIVIFDGFVGAMHQALQLFRRLLFFTFATHQALRRTTPEVLSLHLGPIVTIIVFILLVM